MDFIDSSQLAISGGKEVVKTYIGTALNSFSDTLKYKNASPYWNVSSSCVPTKLVYATADEAVPYSTAIKMEQKLIAEAVEHSFTTLQNATHIWTGSHLDNARSTTLQWFKAKL